MSARRTEMHRLQELVRLHRQGTSAREAARLLGMSRNTVSGYVTALRAAGLLEGAVEALPELADLKRALPANLPPQQRSSIEVWAPRVRTLLAGGAQPRGIYDLLRTTESTFSGSLSAVKRLCARLHREVGPRPRDVAIPVDTDAGLSDPTDFSRSVASGSLLALPRPSRLSR
jgi:DNA-binding transcriptional ArsR family regulator